MESTVKSRLLEFLKYKNLSQKKFEIACGLANGYVNNIRKSITIEKLQKITRQFPELNKTWLLTGEGMMINGVAQTVSNIFGGGAAPEPEPRQSVLDQSSIINALIASNSAALAAKNETIAALRRELTAKDNIIALLQQQLQSLQNQIDDLRAQLSAVRSAVRSAPSTLLDYPFPIGTADDLKNPPTPRK